MIRKNTNEAALKKTRWKTNRVYVVWITSHTVAVPFYNYRLEISLHHFNGQFIISIKQASLNWGLHDKKVFQRPPADENRSHYSRVPSLTYPYQTRELSAASNFNGALDPNKTAKLPNSTGTCCTAGAL